MNYKIVIDPGHGGTDPGATANNIIEKDLTLKISKYMKDKLEGLGIPVSITRTNDETLSPNERVKRIKQFYGNGKDVIVISNHINAGGGDGAEVIYALRNNDSLANMIANEIASSNQNVRKVYQRRLPSNPSQDYYFILRDTKDNQSIIVEYGFLDSTKDDVMQLKNNWQELTDAVIKGLLKYIGKNEINNDIYIVKPGDTLWGIAKKHNITVENIKSINKLNTNMLSVGQKLNLKQPNTNNIYIVKKGDTLYNIAKENNTTVTDLKSLNNLKNDSLSINQKLLLPNNKKVYIVQKGDTLYSIAKNNNTTVAVIKNINSLTTDSLTINQRLLLP